MARKLLDRLRDKNRVMLYTDSVSIRFLILKNQLFFYFFELLGPVQNDTYIS
jgi:hypothetical protein